MKISIANTILLASSFAPALAHPTSSQKTCTEYTIPVTSTSLNWIWGYPQFITNYDVVNFISDVEARVPSPDFHVVIGRENQTFSHSIGATFCTPKSTNKNIKTVLLATHGVDFDRSYWDLQIPGKEGYSFVDHAISKGYSVLFYDRVGVGASSVLSGYINQIAIQIEVLKSIVASVKQGKYTAAIGVPEKLVLVGHSFGSAIAAAAAAENPAIAEALILTGFSFNSTAINGNGFLETIGFRIASGVSRAWRKYDTGYVTPVDTYSNVNTFLKQPDFDVSVAEYAFANRAPMGILEPVSLSLPNLTLAPTTYTGAALLMAGQFDFLFCHGQCDDVIATPSTDIFAHAKNFKAVSYPGSGHAINLAKNVTGAYDIITDFLAESGL